MKRIWIGLLVSMVVWSVSAQTTSDKEVILDELLKMHEHYRQVKQNLTMEMAMDIEHQGKMVAEGQAFACQYLDDRIFIRHESWEALALKDEYVLLNKTTRQLFYSEQSIPQLQQSDLLESIDQLKVLVEQTDKMEMTRSATEINCAFWPEQGGYSYVALKMDPATAALKQVEFKKTQALEVPGKVDEVTVYVRILQEKRETNKKDFDRNRYLTGKGKELTASAKYSDYEIIRY